MGFFRKLKIGFLAKSTMKFSRICCWMFISGIKLMSQTNHGLIGSLVAAKLKKYKLLTHKLYKVNSDNITLISLKSTPTLLYLSLISH